MKRSLAVIGIISYKKDAPLCIICKPGSRHIPLFAMLPFRNSQKIFFESILAMIFLPVRDDGLVNVTMERGEVEGEEVELGGGGGGEERGEVLLL